MACNRLKRGWLGEIFLDCKSFGFSSYGQGLEVLILEELREGDFGSVDSKEFTGEAGRAGGGVAVVHEVLYIKSKLWSRDFIGAKTKTEMGNSEFGGAERSGWGGGVGDGLNGAGGLEFALEWGHQGEERKNRTRPVRGYARSEGLSLRRAPWRR
jgi:hypothetical protein